MPLLACRRLAFRLAAGAAVALAAAPALPTTRRPSWSPTTAAQAIDIIKTTTGAQRQAGDPAGPADQVRPALHGADGAGHPLGQGHARAAGPLREGDRDAPRPRPTASASASMAARRSPSARPRPGPTASSSSTAGSTRPTASPSSSNGRSASSRRGLRITDVKIEGVSMVMTRRSDFNSYIQQNGGKVQPLIDELEARAAR